MNKNLTSALVTAALLSGFALPAVARTSVAETGLIKAGTEVKVKLEQPLDSSKNHDGDTFVVDVIPGLLGDKGFKGDKLEGHLEAVHAAGKMGKKGSMELVFDDLLTPDGHQTPVQVRVTSAPVLKPQGKKLRNVAIILGGALVGHHVAKKAGKKHGALLGAAAATAVVLALPGGNVAVPRGGEMKVKFEQPVDLHANQ